MSTHIKAADVSTLDDLRKLRDDNEDGWTPEVFNAVEWSALLDYTIALAEAAERRRQSPAERSLAELVGDVEVEPGQAERIFEEASTWAAEGYLAGYWVRRNK